MFPNRFKHSQYIFDRGLGLNIMDCIEDKPTAFAENLDPFSNLSFDFFRSPEGKRLLCVDPSSPEGNPVSKSLFKLPGIHLSGRALDRV